jgi:hypothetical protein
MVGRQQKPTSSNNAQQQPAPGQVVVALAIHRIMFIVSLIIRPSVSSKCATCRSVSFRAITRDELLGQDRPSNSNDFEEEGEKGGTTFASFSSPNTKHRFS